MPRLPISQRKDLSTEGDGSFDSQFTEGARAMLESLNAYIASHHPMDAVEAKPSVGHDGKMDASLTSLPSPDQ